MEHTSQTGEMDRLSGLPEDVLLHIISFLPTFLAARTSLVCCRFRRLWESSPFITLYTHHRLSPSNFMDLANRIILNRNPPSPILHLYLNFLYGNYEPPIEASYIASLLDKSDSLGITHLTVGLLPDTYQTILPHVFSLYSPEFLSIQCVYCNCQLTSSTTINLKNLKILCIHFISASSGELINQLVPQLYALEDLHIKSPFIKEILHLKSMTMRKLELDVLTPNLRISAPSLELFEFKSIHYGLNRYGNIQWVMEIPRLRKATIQIDFVSEWNVESISKMLNTIAHVQELHLVINEEWYEGDTFHTLLGPYVDPPTYINLKHFHLEICFHELNVEDLVTIIQHSPALESLKLVHKPPIRLGRKKKKKLWKSMLPRNAERNHRHAHYENLHIAEKKVDLLRKLTKTGSSKRLKT